MGPHSGGSAPAGVAAVRNGIVRLFGRSCVEKDAHERPARIFALARACIHSMAGASCAGTSAAEISAASSFVTARTAEWAAFVGWIEGAIMSPHLTDAQRTALALEVAQLSKGLSPLVRRWPVGARVASGIDVALEAAAHAHSAVLRARVDLLSLSALLPSLSAAGPSSGEPLGRDSADDFLVDLILLFVDARASVATNPSTGAATALADAWRQLRKALTPTTDDGGDAFWASFNRRVNALDPSSGEPSKLHGEYSARPLLTPAEWSDFAWDLLAFVTRATEGRSSAADIAHSAGNWAMVEHLLKAVARDGQPSRAVLLRVLALCVHWPPHTPAIELIWDAFRKTRLDDSATAPRGAALALPGFLDPRSQDFVLVQNPPFASVASPAADDTPFALFLRAVLVMLRRDEAAARHPHDADSVEARRTVKLVSRLLLTLPKVSVAVHGEGDLQHTSAPNSGTSTTPTALRNQLALLVALSSVGSASHRQQLAARMGSVLDWDRSDHTARELFIASLVSMCVAMACGDADIETPCRSITEVAAILRTDLVRGVGRPAVRLAVALLGGCADILRWCVARAADACSTAAVGNLLHIARASLALSQSLLDPHRELGEDLRPHSASLLADACSALLSDGVAASLGLRPALAVSVAVDDSDASQDDLIFACSEIDDILATAGAPSRPSAAPLPAAPSEALATNIDALAAALFAAFEGLWTYVRYRPKESLGPIASAMAHLANATVCVCESLPEARYRKIRNGPRLTWAWMSSTLGPGSAWAKVVGSPTERRLLVLQLWSKLLSLVRPPTLCPFGDNVGPAIAMWLAFVCDVDAPQHDVSVLTVELARRVPLFARVVGMPLADFGRLSSSAVESRLQVLASFFKGSAAPEVQGVRWLGDLGDIVASLQTCDDASRTVSATERAAFCGCVCALAFEHAGGILGAGKPAALVRLVSACLSPAAVAALSPGFRLRGTEGQAGEDVLNTVVRSVLLGCARVPPSPQRNTLMAAVADAVKHVIDAPHAESPQSDESASPRARLKVIAAALGASESSSVRTHLVDGLVRHYAQQLLYESPAQAVLDPLAAEYDAQIAPAENAAAESAGRIVALAQFLITDTLERGVADASSAAAVVGACDEWVKSVGPFLLAVACMFMRTSSGQRPFYVAAKAAEEHARVVSLAQVAIPQAGTDGHLFVAFAKTVCDVAVREFAIALRSMSGAPADAQVFSDDLRHMHTAVSELVAMAKGARRASLYAPAARDSATDVLLGDVGGRLFVRRLARLHRLQRSSKQPRPSSAASWMALSAFAVHPWTREHVISTVLPVLRACIPADEDAGAKPRPFAKELRKLMTVAGVP